MDRKAVQSNVGNLNVAAVPDEVQELTLNTTELITMTDSCTC